MISRGGLVPFQRTETVVSQLHGAQQQQTREILDAGPISASEWATGLGKLLYDRSVPTDYRDTFWPAHCVNA